MVSKLYHSQHIPKWTIFYGDGQFILHEHVSQAFKSFNLTFAKLNFLHQIFWWMCMQNYWLQYKFHPFNVWKGFNTSHLPYISKFHPCSKYCHMAKYSSHYQIFYLHSKVYYKIILYIWQYIYKKFFNSHLFWLNSHPSHVRFYAD